MERKYASIKQLVIDETISQGQYPSLDNLTTLVKEHFPNSRWQKSHYDYYKSLINTGKLEVSLAPDGYGLDDESDRTGEGISEFGLSIERDLQSYLSKRLGEIEDGLTLLATEYATSAGFIDILAKDKAGNHVVIELKAGTAKDAALGQLLGYIGALQEGGFRGLLRGIIIAQDFENRLTYAAKVLPNINLLKYSISFKFDPALR